MSQILPTLKEFQSLSSSVRVGGHGTSPLHQEGAMGTGSCGPWSRKSSPQGCPWPWCLWVAKMPVSWWLQWGEVPGEVLAEPGCPCCHSPLGSSSFPSASSPGSVSSIFGGDYFPVVILTLSLLFPRSSPWHTHALCNIIISCTIFFYVEPESCSLLFTMTMFK